MTGVISCDVMNVLILALLNEQSWIWIYSLNIAYSPLSFCKNIWMETQNMMKAKQSELWDHYFSFVFSYCHPFCDSFCKV